MYRFTCRKNDKIFNKRNIIDSYSLKIRKRQDQEETIIQKFKKGSHQVAFVVDMVNEGISINDIECLMFLDHRVKSNL